ncbi:hypothetical protein F4859DRAFT_411691 [Xylaria cf. heliscus]|nr:hypothetical protein F4859DRAFT_411691 [Xylaria cf. heliscus]
MAVRNKNPRYLVPARDSRHRAACLALYRALLRLAPQISLPANLATGWGANKNPIALQISRAFRRNTQDTSPRIIHPTMSAGYRMLSVLHSAATSPKSTDHASIITFLESRLAERQRSLANRPPPPTGPKPGSPRPGTLPLLVRVSTPRGAPPEYATPYRPRPHEELGGTGRRKIPRLDMAGDFPFLRLKKPQPTELSRVLGQRIKKRVVRMEAAQEMEEYDIPEAALEDAWDEEMDRLMREEGEGEDYEEEEEWPRRTRSGRNTDPGLSYAASLRWYGLKDLRDRMTRERLEQVARADAMRRLIKQEAALAAAEKEQRAVDKRARWEARMLELHGPTWRDQFPNLKDGEAGKRL